MQNGYSVMGFCKSGELIHTPHGNTPNKKEILQLETEKLHNLNEKSALQIEIYH